MKAGQRGYEARRNGRLMYVSRDGEVLRETAAKASLHVANYKGVVDLEQPQPTQVDGRWGYLDAEGAFAPAPEPDGASPFSGGRAFTAMRAGIGSRHTAVLHWRLIDENLRLLGEIRVVEFHPFQGGTAPCCAVDASDPLDVYGGRRRWGLLSREGTWLVEPSWDWLGPLCDGRAAARIDGAYGFIDATGAWKVEPRYDLVTDFTDGMAQVALQDDRAAIAVPETGRLVITPAFIGRFGVVDREGRLLHPISARAPVLGLRAGQETREGRSIVQRDGKYGFVDLAGESIVDPVYDYVLPFSEGLARVRRGKKEGFVDRDGNEVIAPTLDAALPFSEGLAAAQKSVPVIDPKSQKTVKRARWGFVDARGEWVIAPTFGPVSSFRDGLALVWVDEKRVGYVDRSGVLVWQE